MNRIEREKEIVGLMIALFCTDHHATHDGLCRECEELRQYAYNQLSHCPYKNKPRCVDCKVHCFNDKRREEIRLVMRYAGRRMPFKHPWKTLLYYLRRG